MKKVAMIIVFISLSFLIGCAVLDTLVDSASEGVAIAKKVLPNTNWTATLLAGMIGVLGFYKKFRADKQVKAGIEGVEDIREKVFSLWGEYKKTLKAPSWEKFSEVIDDAMRTKAIAYGVYTEMKNKVRRIRNDKLI